jgi:hypothetical protein
LPKKAQVKQIPQLPIEPNYEAGCCILLRPGV